MFPSAWLAWNWLIKPRPRLLLYTVLIIVPVTLGIGRIVVDDPSLVDNFLSEAIGVTFTVLVVDWLLHRAEQQRTKAARFAAFRAVTEMYRRLRFLWATMVKCAGLLSSGDSHLLTPHYVDAIKRNLDLRSCSPVDTMGGGEYLNHLATGVNQLIADSLDRYLAYLDPDTTRILQDIEHGSFMSFCLSAAEIQRESKEIEETKNHNPYTRDITKHGLQAIVDSMTHLHWILDREQREFLPRSMRGSATYMPHVEFDVEISSIGPSN